MANDILKTLQAMESDLAEIKSAKEQVEAVIAADATINSSIKSYANALSSLSSKLNVVKESFESAVTTIDDTTSKFSISLDSRKKDIESATNKLSDILNDFKTQTEVLGIRTIAEKTQQIQNAYERLNTRLSEIESKQQNITTTITTTVENSNDNLKKHTEDIKEVISKAIDTKTSAINSSISSLDMELGHHISANNSSLLLKAEEILNKVATTEDSTRDIIKEEATRIEKIQNSSEQNIKNIISYSNKKYMWITLIVIILVCIDLIIHLYNLLQ